MKKSAIRARTQAQLRRHTGISIVEIMIVAALASMILMGATVMMGRTTRQFKKGEDMMNTQVLMDSIVENLRTDVRSLRSVITCTDHEFSFVRIRDGAEVNVKYTFEPPESYTTDSQKRPGKSGGGTLYREEDGKKTSFHGANQVAAFTFQGYPSDTEFRHLNVAMQIISDEKGEGRQTRLSIVCQFYSTCLEGYTPFGR